MSIDRRQAIKLMAAASAAAWTPAHVALARARATEAIGQGTFAPEFFSDHEYATVRVLVDFIIPADDRSGSATDVGVPEFMDFMMIDQPRSQGWMRGGLAWLDIECRQRFDLSFLDASEAQQVEMLDAIAWPDQADDDVSHGVTFFNRFRDLTSSGFWTTEVGIADLQYMGNRVVPEWTGCPEAAERHVGVFEADD